MAEFTKSIDGGFRRTFQIEFRLSKEDIAHLVAMHMGTFVVSEEREVVLNLMTRKSLNEMVRKDLWNYGSSVLENSTELSEAMYNRIREVVNKLM